MEKLAYNTNEIAEILGISEWKIYDLVRTNGIPHKKIGRKLLFSKLLIEKWLSDDTNIN